jgi:hypothetical protein
MQLRNGRGVWRVVAGALLSGLTCCGGAGVTGPDELGTFDGEYVLRIGSDVIGMRGTDYLYTDHREVILHGSNGASVRMDFSYAERGRSADEVRDVSVLRFPGFLTGAQGATAPKIVVRGGRNEIDDGVLEGTIGFPETPVADLHWSLRAQ